MKEKYSDVLLDEYTAAKKEPLYCDLGLEQKVIVPLSYKNNVEQFIDDIFAYDEISQEYDKYNQNKADGLPEYDSEMIKSGEISFLPRLEYLQKKYTQSKMVQKSVANALRRYRAAIRLAQRAKKEYPHEEILVKMDSDTLKDFKKKHYLYQTRQVLKKIGKGLKFTAKQTAQMVAGTSGLLPVAVYRFLDKKAHFSRSKTKSFIDEKMVPYIQKGALKALIPLSLFAATKFMPSKNNQDKISIKDKIEQVQTARVKVDNLKQENQGTQISEFAFTPTDFLFIDTFHEINITDQKSFDIMYDKCFNSIILSMMPTEILINSPYTDNGKVINTIGLGSYYYPENGDPKNDLWVLASKYFKNNKDVNVTGEGACQLVDGWFQHRDNGRIYKKMYNKLSGTKLKSYEFDAIFSVMYNNETNGAKLCDFVQDNIQDKIKCAVKIMKMLPRSEKFRAGIKKRRIHEALLFLNIDNYSRKIPFMNVKEGQTKKGNPFYVSSITNLDENDYDKMLAGLEAGRLDEAREVMCKIAAFDEGKPIYEIAWEQGIGHIIPNQNMAGLYAQNLVKQNKARG